MDLHYLKLFNILAKELSYSKAASTLFISQPAVSMQIKKLENDLGLKLFDKVGKNIHLNDNGKVLYEYTKNIFSLVDEVETRLSNMSGEVRGVVNIGASNTPGTYILPKILGIFKEHFPLVNTNLHIANTFEIERMIFENKIDFAINGGDISYNSQIYVENMADDEAMFVASPNSEYVSKQVIAPSELYDAKYIVHEKNSQLHILTEEIISKLGLNFNISMCLGSIDAIKQAVSANLGISVIPKSAISIELKYNILKVININGMEWRYPYKLIYHKSKYLSPAAEALIALIRKNMKIYNIAL